ncbi:PQQ-binding-like beta-propeller repeat protein [Deltaproteobacteria bacterium TL4]
MHGYCALDIKTGRLLWKHKTGNSVKTAPTVVNGMVYFGSNDKYFYALDAKNGELKWKFETQKRVNSSSAIFGNKVYVASRQLHAINTKSGYEKWSVQFGGKNDFFIHTIIANNIIYTSHTDDYLYGISSKGEIMWKFKPGPGWGSPVIVNGVIYYGLGNTFYAVQ